VEAQTVESSNKGVTDISMTDIMWGIIQRVKCGFESILPTVLRSLPFHHSQVAVGDEAVRESGRGYIQETEERFLVDRKIGKVSDRWKNTLRSSSDSILHSPTDSKL
jgi:hypothetical protein